MGLNGIILMDPRAKEPKVLTILDSWKAEDNYIRDFAKTLYQQNLADGLDDPWYCCAILRERERHHVWLGLRCMGQPNTTNENMHKFDISQVAALFGEKWRLATSDEYRQRRKQDFDDALAARGGARQLVQNEFRTKLLAALESA